MAGQIIVSSIKTDSDNSISFVANTGATIFSANLASGLSASSFGNNTITSDKIVSVANTKIDGNIVSSQITSVANTQLTGTVTNAQVGSSVYEGMGMRNRIINGDMRMAQRGTAAVTTNGAFPVDRFQAGNNTDGAFSAQQDSSAPTGFQNSVKFTTTTADATLTTTQSLQFQHKIEGTNFADLGWGAAGAKTVTLSFWVRSSLTGTFGGAAVNDATDRSYPFTYSISVADTWEYKTVTIPGDTTGTWLKNTDTGLRLFFGLGQGPDRQGTADSWAGAFYQSATGAVSVIGTLNATWFVTGVQLEVGSVATPFERRPFGTELALCQRYYYRITPKNTNFFTAGFNNTTIVHRGIANFPTSMRTEPTAIEQTGTATDYGVAHGGSTVTNLSAVVSSFVSSVNSSRISVTVASGLTQGQASMIIANNDTAFLAWSAEL